MTLQWVIMLLLTAATAAVVVSQAQAQAQARPEYCQDRCGNISIPFPFGTDKNCYRKRPFLITCNNKSFNPPKAFLGRSRVEVMDISPHGELRAGVDVALDCDHGFNSHNLVQFRFSRTYSLSNTRNKFTAVGCNTIAYLTDRRGQTYGSACVSLCSNETTFDGSCAGIGCCQVAIPRSLKFKYLTVGSLNNHTDFGSFNPCSYAFVVEERSFEFSPLDDLRNLRNRTAFPVVFDWVIDNLTCEEAKKNQISFACQQNSYCYNSANGPGYRCNCSDGFQGNPYLPAGCTDVNECANQTLHDCIDMDLCVNTIGGFNCSCPKGYHGDGKRGGTGCIANKGTYRLTLIKVTAGIGISIFGLLVGCSWLYWGIKKRNMMRRREKIFRQNGGLMLQPRLSKRDGSVETAKIFTIEELKKATNDFDENRIIGRGGYGTIYKGVLPQNKIVAIKKSTVVDENQIEQFVNEVVVLSQINHRNVVKLLGCCLETEVPLLVYEFITNGTLSHHIHEVDHASIPWKIRLRIAKETAGALSYLHSAASIPIIHRDIKSTNILLDDNFTAKVADFGASRLVPIDKTQLTTLVQGTLGYLDPEYFHSSQLTEKSDVYSFGVVLVELITGKMALSFARPEKERNLAIYFISSMEENRLSQILDHQIANEGNVEQVREVANLAQSCLRLKGGERPTMMEVAMELEGIIRMENRHWVGIEMNSKETEHLLDESLKFGSASTTAGYDSLRNQSIIPVDGGR